MGERRVGDKETGKGLGREVKSKGGKIKIGNKFS